jgi:hypothetical protein
MGVWQGVGLDSLKFNPDPPCPTFLRPAGGWPQATCGHPYVRFRGGPPIRWAACGHLLPFRTPHAKGLCVKSLHPLSLLWSVFISRQDWQRDFTITFLSSQTISSPTSHERETNTNRLIISYIATNKPANRYEQTYQGLAGVDLSEEIP